MDGYVSKPIRTEKLEQTIVQLVSPSKPAEAPVPEDTQRDGVIDRTALLAGVDGNRRLLRELVRLFLADYPQRLAEIKEAAGRGNAEALRIAAHTLKGSVGNFAAKSAFEAAQRLEIMGRDRDLDHADEARMTLESELARLTEVLRKLTKDSSRRKTKRNGDGSRKGGRG
jgi:HPt (histidine-containing phosphotransfer) domain-containing protein